MDPDLQPYGVAAVLAAVVGAMLWLLRRRLRRRIAPLAGVLDGGRGDVSGPVAPTLRGSYGGRPASFTLRPGSRHAPPRFLVSLGCSSSLVLEISPEGPASRIAKGLHLMSDVEIGDPGLDRRAVFRSPEPERLRGALAPAAAREAVAALLEWGIDAIAAGEGTVRARRSGYGVGDLERTRVEAVIASLSSLARALEAAG